MTNNGLMAKSYPTRNFSTPNPESFAEASAAAKPDESIFVSADYFKDVKTDEITDNQPLEAVTEAPYVD